LSEIPSTSRVKCAVSAAVFAVTLTALAYASPADIVEPAAEAKPSTAGEVARPPSVLKPRGGLAWSDYFPNVELTTHNGDQVLFYDDLIKGKTVVINFMYATCTES
jgi:cytochrome oxidase Cu insertion factor (SCO1/SenC/PrrC family)